MGEVKITDEKTGKLIEYYIDDRLKRIIDYKIKKSLSQNDKDCVLVVDGKEGAGKSTLALQMAKCYDPNFNLSRVVFDAESFRDAIFKAKKGQALVYDEAFTGLSSRSSLSTINRALVSLMMQMRQKNLFVIVVLPTFFLLDKYVALWRTKALFHVYESGGRRGYFKVYNSKKKKYLYLAGKQTYSYGGSDKKWKVFTKFKGRFYGKFALGDKVEEDKYRKKKEKALMETEKNPMSAGQVKYRDQRDICIFLLRKYLKLGYAQLENIFAEYEFDMSYVQIRNVCVKFGDKETDEDKKIKRERNKTKREKIEKTFEDNQEDSEEDKEEMNFDEVKEPILENVPIEDENSNGDEELFEEDDKNYE
jgi:hypothetical protein